VPEGRTVFYHSESGILNCGPVVDPGNVDDEDINLINAGGQYLQSVGGMSFFDSAEAFAMIRGGHVDVTVLGSHQVSATGDLANWMLPQRGVGNVGGAMDLATGARVIVAMEHTDRTGAPKIVQECTFPLTGKGCVYLIVTDLAVIECDGKGLTLKEVAPDWTPEEVQQLTGAKLTVSPDIREFEL
jgi:3-oxoacid CoA-transferase subunit B